MSVARKNAYIVILLVISELGVTGASSFIDPKIIEILNCAGSHYGGFMGCGGIPEHVGRVYVRSWLQPVYITSNSGAGYPNISMCDTCVLWLAS